MSLLRLARACGFAALGCAVAASSEALVDVPIFADAFENGDCSAWSFCTTSPAVHLLTEPEPSVDFGERVPLRVRLLDATGLPLDALFVTFEPQQDTADTTLSPSGALTDPDGIADTVIHGGSQLVDFEVKVSVPQDDTVTPLTVRVRIQPKDSADYIVSVSYPGVTLLYGVEVTLFESTRSCASLLESPTEDPSEDVAWTSLVILADAYGWLPPRGLNVPSEVTFHYAVARGRSSDGMGGPLDYFVTFGCQDTIPLPELGTAATIEISMHDLFPPG